LRERGGVVELVAERSEIVGRNRGQRKQGEEGQRFSDAYIVCVSE
jgi:hypothetical protein